MKRKYFATPYLVWMIVLIVAPMILIAYYAFTGQADGALRSTTSKQRSTPFT